MSVVEVPVCHDPLSDVVAAIAQALRELFSEKSSCPPLAGGSDKVRFFIGDGTPISAWHSHSSDVECGAPFLWVRLDRRYRSNSFPNPTTGTGMCRWPKVAAFEIGVARCAVSEVDPSWADYEEEFEVGLDDSWRLEKMSCRLAQLLDGHAVTVDTITPYGPSGGIIAWTATVYVQF